MKKEIEIKIKIDEKLFNKLIKDKNFQFERTYGFFTENYINVEKGIFPRIKEKKEFSLVTIKVKKKEDTKMFEREEYEFETESSNVDTIREMFNILGYGVEHIFEKKRYNLNSVCNCEFVVDELPFGYFIELEGDEKNIEQAIKNLDIGEYERINGAYLKLWEEYKKKNNLNGECVFK